MRKTFNKVSTLAISMALVVNMAAPLAAYAQFVDTSGHWAQQAIENLSRQGIITGYPSGEFRPEGQVNRAEFATMLVKALHMENQFINNGSNFADVPSSFWAYRAIETVSDNHLVAGYPGGYFRPTQNISRAEVMSILVKAGGIAPPNDNQAEDILSRFPDNAQIPQWARPSVAAAIQSGIYTNFPNTSLVEPNKPASRGEVAMMANNFEDYQQTRMGHAAPPPSQVIPGTITGSATQQGDLLKGRVSVVPAKTVFTGLILQAISSDRSQVGDPVTVTLDRPILSASGDIVIPQGSQVFGRITRIAPAGRGEKNAEMDLDFNQVRTPDGKTYSLSAEVNSDKGTLVGGTTKGRVGRIAGRTLGGAAIGGAAGAVIGRIAKKGRADEGLLWGSVIGSSLGAASAVVSKGKEVIVQPGEALEIRLRQPLSISNP